MRTLGYLLIGMMSSVLAQTQIPAVDARKGVDVQVPGNQAWTDTGIDVKSGDTILIEATGELTFAGQTQAVTPAGVKRGWRDEVKTYPANEAGRGALIGRIGQLTAAPPFIAGSKHEFRAARAGRLYLGLNYASNDSAEGAFTAHITVTPGTSEEYKGPLPALTQGQLDSIPVRVQDKAGNPGDRTNFILIGSERQVRQALEEAGWVTVDRNVRDTLRTGIVDVMSKKAYLTVPMSELYLFGRPQDYGFAHADPLSVAASRHHFRIWKAPWSTDTATVWIGAGTHDIGFDRDQRNNNLTHKIDPDTDLEREFIALSLAETGAAVKTAYLAPAKPVKTAKTAHGEEFHSDGRTLIIWLRPGDSVVK